VYHVPRIRQPSSTMDLLPKDDAVFDSNTDVLPILKITYEDAPVDDASVLAIVAFGRAAARGESKYVNVALEPLQKNDARREVWRTHGSVRTGVHENVRWSSDGNYAFAVVELSESEHGGIEETARQAYADLVAWVQASATPNFLRIWNYFDAINEGDGDDERYRKFCSGRAAGLGAAFAGNYSAASAIGTHDDRRIVQVYALAARTAGAPVENPRQVNAWRYPRQYGPTSPGFARAMRAPTQFPQLYISGTAAVVGHESHHAGEIKAQLEETLTNLQTLLESARSASRLGESGGDILKVYVRNPDDVQWLQNILRSRLSDDVPLIFLHGDICRSELLLEIDGVHAG
jgi:chorismate lyase / 3-hydroxybenzoate synthase